MTIARDAVFLLTCADPSKKKVFGTGFAVAHRDGQLYILTCAHVVEDLNRKVMANGYEAEIVETTGSRDTIDLALLRISYKNKETPPLLNRANRGKPDKRFQLCGYGIFRGAKDNHARREIQGSLGEDLGLTFDVGKSSIEAWELKIDSHDPLSKLQPGYSGSPLCDEDGRLIGVVSHEGGGGKFGYAVGLSNLKTIYPEIESLIPSFSTPCSVASPADRIALAKKQLRSLLPDFDIDDKLYDRLTKAVRNEFKRMDEKGLCPEDEALLEKIGNAADRPDEWEVLVRFLESLDRKRQDIAEGPDYLRLANQLVRGEVILCLGQEISHLLGAQIPSTAEIKKCLCQGGCHAPLSELCEQKLISPGSSRTDLVHEFRELMDRKTSSVVLHEVLSEFKQLFMVILAGYDNMLQEILRAKRRDFVEIYPDMEEGKCLLIYSDKEKIICTPDEISALDPIKDGYSVIYRLRGGIVGNQEHLLLTERDYFAFNRLIEQQFPNYISKRLKSSLCSLWFIGHHPQSWEERLLIGFLKELQHNDAASLVVQENIPSFDHDFWQYKGVKVHDLALADFVQKLEAAL